MVLWIAFAAVQGSVALPSVSEFTPKWTAPLAPLRSWEQHDAIAAILQEPFVIRMGRSAVVGIRHSLDPADPQFAVVQEIWKQTDPTVILVEGRPGLFFGQREEVVKRLGETGWAMLRAKEEKRSIYSWEPTRSAELEAIRKEGSDREAAAYLFLRVYFGDRRGEPIDDSRAETLLKKRLAQYGLGSAFSSLAEFDSYWRESWPKLADWRSLPEEVLGRKSDAVFGRIGFQVGEVRSTNLARCILDLIDKGERVFALCGSGHAIRIEPCLAKD